MVFSFVFRDCFFKEPAFHIISPSVIVISEPCISTCVLLHTPYSTDSRIIAWIASDDISDGSLFLIQRRHKKRVKTYGYVYIYVYTGSFQKSWFPSK